MAIVHYETTAPLAVTRLGFTKATFARLASNREVPEYGRLAADEYDDARALVEDFLAEIFTQDVPPGEEYRYKLSVAAAEKMTNTDLLDGLMYPTVPMNGNTDNIALKPAYADRALRATYTEWVEVTAMQGTLGSFDVLDEARNFNPDGTIQWLGHPGTWQLREDDDELRFEARNGHWIATDRAGNNVDPS